MWLVLTLWGCASEPTGPVFTPVTDWRGTASEVVLASKPRFTAETALAAAKEAGVVLADSDPDLSGMWEYEPRDLGDGVIIEVRGLRSQAAPGVYHSVSTLYKHQDFRPVLQLEATGFEVIGSNMRCEFIVKSMFSYVDKAARNWWAKHQKDDGPDALNANPCEPVVGWTADSVTARGQDGVEYVEKRRVLTKP